MPINKVLNRYFLSAPSAPPVAIDAPDSYLFTKAPEIMYFLWIPTIDAYQYSMCRYLVLPLHGSLTTRFSK